LQQVDAKRDQLIFVWNEMSGKAYNNKEKKTQHQCDEERGNKRMVQNMVCHWEEVVDLLIFFIEKFSQLFDGKRANIKHDQIANK
jgi:hypothetical protein